MFFNSHYNILVETNSQRRTVWPDWAIYCTLGNFSKLVATISLPKLHTLLGNFCKGIKIVHLSSGIMFGQLLYTFGEFLLVTLEEILNFQPSVNGLRIQCDRIVWEKTRFPPQISMAVGFELTITWSSVSCYNYYTSSQSSRYLYALSS